MIKNTNPIVRCFLGFLLILLFTSCNQYQGDTAMDYSTISENSHSSNAFLTHSLDRLLPPYSTIWARFNQSSKILKAGANRLCDLQADIIGDNAHNNYIDDDPDDGGWDWEVTPSTLHHSVNQSPKNTYGVTAVGLEAAYLVSKGDPRISTCCLDAYLGIERRPEVNSAPDIGFLVFLDFMLHNPGFRELARQKYDAKVASYGGAKELAEYIRDARGTAGQDGLIPYDLGWLVWAAVALDYAFPSQGYDQHAGIYGTVIADDIHNPSGYFNIDDPNEPYYIDGISWGISALALSMTDPNLLSKLRQKLLDTQLPDGSWYFSATYPDSDYQSTAYAVINLGLVFFWDHTARVAAQAGSNWLAAKQLPSGGFEAWPDVENTEIDGEILLSLYLVPPTKIKPGVGDKAGTTRVEKASIRSVQANRPPRAMPLGL